MSNIIAVIFTILQVRALGNGSHTWTVTMVIQRGKIPLLIFNLFQTNQGRGGKKGWLFSTDWHFLGKHRKYPVLMAQMGRSHRPTI